MHPAVRARAAELERAAEGAAVVVHVIPLLVETGQQQNFDFVVVVDVDQEAQIQRLRARNGFSRAEAEARIAAQATREDRRAGGRRGAGQHRNPRTTSSDQIDCTVGRSDFRCRPAVTYSQCSRSSGFLSRGGLPAQGPLAACRVKEGQRCNAHGVGLNSPRSPTSAMCAARTCAQPISLEGSRLRPSPMNRSPLSR